MNAVVTSHLPVCLYSAAGKKVHGGTATRSKDVSFLDNELREGVFRTFGFLKPKETFFTDQARYEK
jgi:hypothetical protein